MRQNKENLEHFENGKNAASIKKCTKLFQAQEKSCLNTILALTQTKKTGGGSRPVRLIPS